MRVGESMAQTHVRTLPSNLRTTMLNRLHDAFCCAARSRKSYSRSVYHRTSQLLFERLRVALYIAAVERTARVLRPK